MNNLHKTKVSVLSSMVELSDIIKSDEFGKLSQDKQDMYRGLGRDAIKIMKRLKMRERELIKIGEVKFFW
jgi:hypothetical protein